MVQRILLINNPILIDRENILKLRTLNVSEILPFKVMFFILRPYKFLWIITVYITGKLPYFSYVCEDMPTGIF